MSEVLKSCGIDSHHKQFRLFLQQLFKVCSKQWLQRSNIEVKTSTSEAMRALVMMHKSTVLKLKLVSPKNSTKINEVSASKPKSVADVKKVLFTDTTPKSDFQFKKFGSELEKEPPIAIVVSKETDDFENNFVTKLSSNKSTVGLSNSLISTSEYSSNLDITFKDSGV